MATFSPSDAALEGFQLVRRHWRLIVGWSLFNVVALVALAVALVVVLIGISPFAGSRGAAEVWGAILGGLIVGLGSAAVEFVIYCGLLRVELAPDAPAFLHLRMGRDEVRVFAASLLLAILALPPLAVAVLATRAAAGLSIFAAVGVGLVAFLAFYALLLRFALMPVIAFQERRISLVESWRRTRGQTWRLLGMSLLLLCLMLLMAVVIWIAVFVVSGFLTGFGDRDLHGAEAFAAHPGRYLFQTGVQLLLAPVWIVISQAPWVAVYRALTPGEAA